jgi:hypothetical protein
LRAAGFHAELERKSYTWDFPSEAEMVMFAKCLFGLDKATDEQILGGITEHLSPIYEVDGVRFNWELAFYSMKKC